MSSDTVQKNKHTGKPQPQNNLTLFVKWLLRRHHKLGGVTEIRAIADRPAKMIWSGYFDLKHAKDLVQQILPDPDGPRPKIPFGENPQIGEANFYYTMQPVKPALLARSANEFARCEATKDADVVCYTLFAVDVDAARPSGISATEEEKKEARKVANAVGKWLKERGVSFIPADSGNGYHLLVPTIPYKDAPAASASAKALLQLLDKEFSTDTATVDTIIHNPGRILKLYGTKAVKGSNMPDRPHRYAAVGLDNIPDDVDLFGVLADELAAFQAASTPAPAAVTSGGATAPKKGKAAPPSQPPVNAWDAETSAKVLRAVLQRSGLVYREKAKPAGLVFEFEDCPSHTDPDGHHYECCVITRPDGSFAAKCQHDPETKWQNFKALIAWDEHITEVRAELGLAKPQPYKMTPGGLVHMKQGRDCVYEVGLTNFPARIVTQIAEDDGVEVRRVFEMEATVDGCPKRFAVPAQQFAAMNWPVEHLGAGAVVYAGQGVKDHARTALQLLSPPIETKTVYTHVGWRKVADRWVYLHAGGAIGSDGVEPEVRVEVGEPFTRFMLPELNMGLQLKKAARASMRMLDVAPPIITFPLFASIFAAVIGRTDHSIHLVGPTGSGKSELAALVQQHWGAELDARHLPGNWSSTANANEMLAFTAKDAILTIDDFAPTGSSYDVHKTHREADRLLRGQGNSAGRGRLRSDASLRPPKPPRGLIVSTGEDTPRGQSLRARMLVLEVSPQAVDWTQLTRRQKDAAEGRYALLLAGFVTWLAGWYGSLRELMPDRIKEIRTAATSSILHKRTPGIVANLYFALIVFSEFAVAVAALDEEEAAALLQKGWEALGEAAAAQVIIQASSDPVQRFIDLLTAAVAAGKGHIASQNGNDPPHPEAWGWRPLCEGWEPRGDRVGWVYKETLYLEPEVAFNVAQQFGQHGGEPLSIGSKTLHKRLHERGLLVQIDKKRNRLTPRKMLEGKQREVLWLPSTLLGARAAPKPTT